MQLEFFLVGGGVNVQQQWAISSCVVDLRLHVLHYITLPVVGHLDF